MTRLNVGDWVKFSPSPNNPIRFSSSLNPKRMIKGYISQIEGSWVAIRGEDRKSYVGQAIADIEPLEEEYTQEALKTLINIALDTNDRNWFNELTSELKRIQEVEG